MDVVAFGYVEGKLGFVEDSVVFIVFLRLLAIFGVGGV